MRRFGWAYAITAAVVGFIHVPFQEPAFTSVEVGQPQTVVRFGFSDESLADESSQLVLQPVAMADGQVTLVSRDPGWAVEFPPVCEVSPGACPRAILESGPAPWLNPGNRPVRWGASVRLESGQVSEGSNVMQKGLSASGTQFKLQVDGWAGRPSCVMAGQVGQLHEIYRALAAQGIADGQWHELRCERHATALWLLIDGQRASETAIPPSLSIVNESPLRLGGKGVGPFNDQFHGAVDDVFIEIG